MSSTGKVTKARPLRPLEAVRAFGVMLGGSVGLAMISIAGIAAALRALARRRAPHPPALGVCTATLLYVRLLRPWLLHWGATQGELERPLPGDESPPADGTDMVRAVTIDAAPEDVWPWLAQIGQDRGGFYSYEWLENLAGCEMRNADRVHPEWQERQIGETVFLHPAGGMEVSIFEPGRALGLKGWGTFVIEPTGDGRTRLLAKGRAPRGPLAAAYGLLMEIPHFLMERKMLLGIKNRAESARR